MAKTTKKDNATIDIPLLAKICETPGVSGFEQQIREVILKEIRFGPNTNEHDFDFKVKHAKTFLGEGAKIKAYVHFVGRSIVFSDRGRDLLARFTAALTEEGKVEVEPKLEGKRMFLIMAPKLKK